MAVADPTALRVIVTQMSARHNYALPRMLHRQGVLERFYTDGMISQRTANLMSPVLERISPSLAGRLRRRTVEGVPDRLIRSAPLMHAVGLMASKHGNLERYLTEDESFGRQMIRWGLGSANVIYGVYGSGTPFWRHARQEGVKVAVDVIITPLYQRIVAAEEAAFPDWTTSTGPGEEALSLSDELSCRNLAAADLLICPSANVARDVVTFAAVQGTRLATLAPRTVVSYGMRSAAPRPSQSEPGRILFAGGAELRKGIHYFARAANLLQSHGEALSFRVAGRVEPVVLQHPAARALTFLGHLSRDALEEEMLRADVMVLPTIAEGSATVVHEALALGLPVITTESAGSVVVDGQEGLIIPERDADALATAITRVLADRTLRHYMSENARMRSADFDEGPWSERLTGALHPLVASH